jgi:hypothetical protein
MNFNLVEMYNGLLRFNKHILNELAEGLKHLPNLDGVSKGDSLIINEQGNPAWGSVAFIPTFENAAYGIEWTKDDNDIIRIGNAKFHRELPIQNRLKGCVYNEKKISYFLNPTGWAKPLENGLIPPLDGSDGDVGVRVPEFYMCVKDTGTKYQLWISDFNIDGTFTRVHPFIISHTKTMTGKEVMMDKIQIKLFVCFCLAVALIAVLGLALVALILFGFGQVLMLMSASLPQLNLIK